MPIRIKICGITRAEDAEAAVRLGADALGFMFYEPSPRCVSFDTAARIMARVPPLIATVGVFVDPSEDFVREAIRRTGLNTLQFHGDEPPEFCARFGLKTIKAFRLKDRDSLARLAPHRNSTWLLDSYVAGIPGGSGQTFNWELAVEARQMGAPILLAGGLTPLNIAEAVRLVAPFGVDVSSGVETAPGRKDPALLEQFIRRARLAAANTERASNPTAP